MSEGADGRGPDRRWGVNRQRLRDLRQQTGQGPADQFRDPYLRVEEIGSVAKDARDTLGCELQCLFLPFKKELLHLSDRLIAHPGDNKEQADK